MYFYHSDTVWNRFPNLAAMAMILGNVRTSSTKTADIDDTLDRVAARLETTSEGETPSIQAWRQAYAAMGFKPTQYRCAAEALLRRYRKDRHLPRLHPLIDALNAESMNAAIPIAVFDCDHVVEGIVVRPAAGTEIYHSFQGETEQPAEGEIIFADAAGQAHSRRWVFRQSAESAVSASSETVLIIAEALHQTALEDLQSLRERIVVRAQQLGAEVIDDQILTGSHRRFVFTNSI